MADKQPVVLIIDDEFGTRLMLRKALEQSGCLVVEAEDGRQGISQMYSARPDLVVLDVMLPDMDGFDVCARLRMDPVYYNVPIVMLTGQHDPAALDQSFAAGASDFLTKPINWTLFGHRIRFLLRWLEANRELEVSQERLCRAQRIARLAYWSWDARQDHFETSSEFAELFGLDQEQLSTSLIAFLERVNSEDGARVRETLERVLADGVSASFDFRFVRPDQHECVIEMQVERIRDSQHRLFGTAQDITERRRVEALLEYQTHYDPLTDLPNRSLLMQRLADALKGLDEGDVMALIMLDVDRFSALNDTLGHHLGDQLLRRVARRLRALPRQVVTLSRLGGDEFAVVCAGLDSVDEVVELVRELRELVESPHRIQGQQLYLTASMGVAVAPEDGRVAEELLSNADMALSRAKQEGGGANRFYTVEMNRFAHQRLTMEHSLRRALERDEFELYYQPIVALEDRRIVGAEALLRWQQPERGMVSPADFIPVAEETGLILPIGHWVLQTACAQAQVWRTAGLADLRIGVNVSAVQMAQADLVREIGEALAQSGLPPDRLNIEITESVAMRNVEANIAQLEQLKALGLNLSVDDFGTGYSSLNYLHRFPLDILKIDRAFIKGIGTPEDDGVIARTVVMMARGLGLKVVAEGVETEAQLAFLADLGCERVQGFYFSRPLPAPEFEALLHKGCFD